MLDFDPPGITSPETAADDPRIGHLLGSGLGEGQRSRCGGCYGAVPSGVDPDVLRTLQPRCTVVVNF